MNKNNLKKHITKSILIAALSCFLFTQTGCFSISEFINDLSNDSQGYGGQATNTVQTTETQPKESAYDIILHGLENYEAEIYVEDISKTDAIATIKDVEAEHPEIFWVNFQNIEYSYGSDHVKFKMEYSGSYSEIEFKKQKFEKKASEIISQLPSDSDDFDKILYIHDYIIDNTDYSTGEDTTSYKEETSAYGCLISNKASCSGYTKAFQYLTRKIGFDCQYITGKDIEDGEGHAWNYILLGGEYYYFDVTWDDPDDKNTTNNHKTYEYFGITTSELLESHSINEDENPPQCTATAYNYYIHEGLNFERYEFSEVESVINNKLYSDDSIDEISLRFDTIEELEKAKEDLIEDENISEISAIRDKIRYDDKQLYYTKDGRYLLFYFK